MSADLHLRLHKRAAGQSYSSAGLSDDASYMQELAAAAQDLASRLADCWCAAAVTAGSTDVGSAY